MPIARALFAYARERAGSGNQQSVVRRTAVLCSLVVPGFAANFLVYFFSAQLLPADQFGVLYVAFTINNVLFSGATILNVFLTRHLVRVGETAGPDAIIPTTLRIARDVGVIGAVISMALFTGLIAAAKQIGVQSPIIILLVVLDAYTAYVTDLGRVLLQVLRKTVWLGLYTSVWMFLRFGLCIGGIVLFNTVWGALSGIVLSAVIVFAVFHVCALYAGRRGGVPAKVTWPLFSLLPAAIGYGLLVLVSNVDVLFGYFALGESDLGVYSASSVFPKAALVVITPLLQMLLPLMSGNDSARPFVLVAARISGVILALTAAGSILVWLLSNQLCGSRWGLKLCEPSLLDVLLISVVPLSLLRTLAVIEFARGRERLLLWLIVPAGFYGLFAWFSQPEATDLATGFSIFAMLAFVFFAATCLMAQALRRRASLTSRTG